MKFITESKSEQQLRHFMAKEKTPIGKFLIQQNLISARLIQLLNYFNYSDLEKLKKFTLGRLVIGTGRVLLSDKDCRFIDYLHKYTILRNTVIHNLDSSVYTSKTQNELYHEIKKVNKIGNIVLGKLESVFIRYKI